MHSTFLLKLYRKRHNHTWQNNNKMYLKGNKVLNRPRSSRQVPVADLVTTAMSIQNP
jgi:hypothetical protein